MYRMKDACGDATPTSRRMKAVRRSSIMRARRGGRSGAAVVRHRRIAAAALLVAIAVGVVSVTGSAVSDLGSVPRPRLSVQAEHRVLLRVPTARYTRNGKPSRRALAKLMSAWLPEQERRRRGAATVTYTYDARATIERALALGVNGGTVQAVRWPVAVHIPTRIVAQVQRNTCESAALQILMTTHGKPVDQRRLQRSFPRSGPADPIDKAGGRVWGDPDLGFVGRADGGGTAGGFGIYPGPVRKTARGFGVSLRDISGRSETELYRILLKGRAAMVWVGLGAGPYGEWRSPAGRRIAVNFNEHTIVLHGIRRDGRLEVTNPLEGTEELWTKSQFATQWARLGRRGLA